MATSTTAIDSYFDSISRCPLLTAEEETACAHLWRTESSPKALQRLIEGNLRLVVKEAKRFQGLGLELVDLISEGNLGLIDAAKRFDPEKNARFATYASWRIRQSIFHALSEGGLTIRLPQKLAARLHQFGKAVQRAEQYWGHRPSAQEIADSSRFSLDEVEKLLPLKHTIAVISASQTINGSDMRVEETLEQDISPTAAETIEGMDREAMINKLRSALAMLTERERRVIEMRYGLNGNQPTALDKIGQAFSPPMSQEMVRRCENRALNNIRKNKRGAFTELLSGAVR